MAQQKTQIEYLNVDDLKAYERNARTHSDEQIKQVAESIKEFGFTNPVLIDEHNELIAGHGRTMAAKSIGMKEVPAIRLKGLTAAQKKALRIADNQLALNAGWDEELLRIELGELQELDFNLDVMGFSDEEPDLLLAGTGSIDDDESHGQDAEEIAEPSEDPVVKPGELWLLGDHQLLCGDSTRIDELVRLCEAGSVDLYLTDPPYNVAYEGKTKDALTIENDNMSDEDFRKFLLDAFSTADFAMKPGASFYIWHADNEGYNFRGACRDNAWKVRQCLVWNKNSLVLGRSDYQWKHEPCLYGWKEGAGHAWYSDRKQTTVLDFDKPLRNGDHPTMKPVDLFEYQIGNSTKKGDVVLDSFAGSGTTVIACENTGRKARAMELDPRYCDVIIKRWQDLTGEDAVREDGVIFNNCR